MAHAVLCHDTSKDIFYYILLNKNANWIKSCFLYDLRPYKKQIACLHYRWRLNLLVSNRYFFLVIVFSLITSFNIPPCHVKSYQIQDCFTINFFVLFCNPCVLLAGCNPVYNSFAYLKQPIPFPTHLINLLMFLFHQRLNQLCLFFHYFSIYKIRQNPSQKTRNCQ